MSTTHKHIRRASARRVAQWHAAAQQNMRARFRDLIIGHLFAGCYVQRFDDGSAIAYIASATRSTERRPALERYLRVEHVVSDWETVHEWDRREMW